VASGTVKRGQRIRVQPSGREVEIARIVTKDGDLTEAVTGQAITITLAEEVDISRGDVFSTALAPATVADQFQAHMVWMAEDPLLPGRNYWIKSGTQTVNTSVTKIKHQINVNTLEHIATRKLQLNSIAEVNLSTDKPLVFDSFTDILGTGGFVLIDRITNLTVAAGLIDHPLSRAQNVQPQYFELNKEVRAKLNNQKPCVLWFTGLSGSGKSSIANELEKKLHEMGHRTYILDGDNIRLGLNKDLGFADQDRVENIRRVAEVAKLMLDAGLIVITTFISPFRADRDMARSLFKVDEFFEIFVDTPIDVCEQRDPKGLYKKARKGEIKNFTGIGQIYQKPENPEITIKTVNYNLDKIIICILDKLSFV
jgi:bifunctional enzyme CysN/CysC